jgi:phosphate starvation-inducible protein PhoH
MKKSKAVVLATLLALALFALTGCDMIAKKAVENATGVKVDENNKSVTITGKNGEQLSASSAEGKVPDGLPADVPVYSGKIKNSAKMETGEGVNYSFAVETDDDIATVVGWYKTKLGEKQWKISSTVTTGETAMLSAEKGEKNKLVITVGKDTSTGKTQIAVINNIKK